LMRHAHRPARGFAPYAEKHARPVLEPGRQEERDGPSRYALRHASCRARCCQHRAVVLLCLLRTHLAPRACHITATATLPNASHNAGREGAASLRERLASPETSGGRPLVRGAASTGRAFFSVYYGCIGGTERVPHHGDGYPCPTRSIIAGRERAASLVGRPPSSVRLALLGTTPARRTSG
jgi:hypothetical protein